MVRQKIRDKVRSSHLYITYCPAESRQTSQQDFFQYNIEKRVTEDDEEDEDDDYTFGPRPKQEDNQAPMFSKC